MRAYIITTGVIFFLMACAHVARVFAEGNRLLTEPDFMLMTIAALGLAIWAAVTLKRGSAPS